MNKNRGFTLIELMIVLVIVAIIVAIAWPSYQNQLRKGRRADAQTFMLDLANKEQQFLLDARSYATGGSALASLNTTVPPTVAQYYAVTIDPGPTVPSFIITARALGVQAPDGDLTLDNTGLKKRNNVSGW